MSYGELLSNVIDFMPLTSVNYSGGIIITDWYSNKKKQNESIKITIRFLTNEIRSDALEIKIFTRKCKDNVVNCELINSSETIVNELRKEILKKVYHIIADQFTSLILNFYFTKKNLLQVNYLSVIKFINYLN